MSAMNPFFSLNALPLFNQINIELHAFSAMRNLIDNQNASIDKFLVDLENKVNENVEINYCDVFDKMASPVTLFILLINTLALLATPF